MLHRCERCVTDKSLCVSCVENPKYDQLKPYSLFREYVPVCPRGYDDCVRDPAYIKHHYPKWYAELYGDITPKEAIRTEGGCWNRVVEDPDEEYFCYDDEDK